MSRHWSVLGAGAMGCLFASRLSQAGSKVTLLLREQPGGSDEMPGTARVRLQDASGVSEVVVDIDRCAGSEPVELLLLTTKAYDAQAALADIAARLDNNSHIVLMVNGMGLIEELKRVHPSLNFYLGTTTEGAYRRGPLSIVHAGKGHTVIGHPEDATAPVWIADWVEALDSCAWEVEIESALWQKLAVNCAINPLTAVHRCRNGELATDPGLANETAAVCSEIARVCRAAGFVDLAGRLQQQVQSVALATAQNSSSMLQDILAGRRTEISYITGYLLQQAETLGVDAPLNRTLMDAVLELENGSKAP